MTFYRELGESNKKETLTKNRARTKAIEYLKQWVPSYLHNYAKPIGEPHFEEGRGIYHFSFPRVVNGIVVEGKSNWMYR